MKPTSFLVALTRTPTIQSRRQPGGCNAHLRNSGQGVQCQRDDYGEQVARVCKRTQPKNPACAYGATPRQYLSHGVRLLTEDETKGEAPEDLPHTECMAISVRALGQVRR